MLTALILGEVCAVGELSLVNIIIVVVSDGVCR